MKKFYTRLLSSFVLAMFANVTIAQYTFSGTVHDANTLLGLPFVSLTINGQPSSQALSDRSGHFSFRADRESAELFVSSLGYKTVPITVSSGTAITITLERDVLNMKDVVLVQRGTAAKFHTLSRIDLDLNPVKNTQELLRLVPGLFIAQHAGGGKAEQIFLRGFDVDHGTDVEITVDGMPVNMVSHAHGQGYADAHFIIPETIDNTDFGAGPYYTQHGNFNTAGYVAYGTKEKIGASRVQVEAGRFNTMRALTLIDLLKSNTEKQTAYVAGEYFYTNGPTINAQNFNRVNLFGKYNLRISPATQLTATSSYFTSQWDASGQIPERAVKSGIIDRFGSIDPSEGGITSRINTNVIMTHNFGNGVSWKNQVFYVQNKFSLFSNFTFFTNDSIRGDAINQAEYRNIYGLHSSLAKAYLVNDWSFKTSMGTSGRLDATKDSRLSKVVNRAFITDVQRGDITELNVSGYLEQQVSRDRWFFEAGVRLDHLRFSYYNKLEQQQQPSRRRSIISPKLNIQYSFSPLLQVYVKTGKGFHSNDSRVVVANEGKDILPAAVGGDLGIVLKPGKRLFVNVAAWYLHLEQEFIYVGDEGIVEPGGRTHRNGLDVLVRYRFASYLFGSLNINATKARAANTQKGMDYIPLAPSLTSTGGLFFKGTKGFTAGINCRYIKSRPANEANTITAKGYFLTDASVNFVKGHFDVGVAIENLFNVEWNEAQFATVSRLRNEPSPIEELHFTPGTPVYGRLKLAYVF